MSVAARNCIFAGISGQVVALDRATGAELWRTRIHATGQMTLAGDDRYLYATGQGRISCLDPATGTVLWRNPLRGLGVGPVAVWTPGSIAAAPTPPPTNATGSPRRR